jgi:hypothetical protein
MRSESRISTFRWAAKTGSTTCVNSGVFNRKRPSANTLELQVRPFIAFAQLQSWGCLQRERVKVGETIAFARTVARARATSPKTRIVRPTIRKRRSINSPFVWGNDLLSASTAFRPVRAMYAYSVTRRSKRAGQTGANKRGVGGLTCCQVTRSPDSLPIRAGLEQLSATLWSAVQRIRRHGLVTWPPRSHRWREPSPNPPDATSRSRTWSISPKRIPLLTSSCWRRTA